MNKKEMLKKMLNAEPQITVNGMELSVGQAMTVRVALQSFAQGLVDDGLGDDEVGKSICQGYLDNIHDINKIIANK